MKLTVTFLLMLLAVSIAAPISSYPNARALGGTAFAFTGAGGRLAQELALAETLLNGTYPSGTAVRPSYFAGVSSGAIITVAMNALLENQENNINGGLTFNDLHNILFSTNDNSVYSFNLLKVASNINHGYVLDTSPLRSYLQSFLNTIGYSVLGDLYLPSYITVVDQRSGVDLRLYSLDSQYSSLPLIDILMSTTAIPVLFSPQQIPALSTFTQFIDGGTGIDYLPIIPLVANPAVQIIYAITYNQAFGYGPSNTDFDAQHGTLVKYAARSYDIQGAGLAIGALSILKASNVTGYVYEPNFSQTFSTTDFNSEQEQYNLAAAWAASNNPINVDQYPLIAANQTLPQYTSADPNIGSIFSSGASSDSAIVSFILASCAVVLAMM